MSGARAKLGKYADERLLVSVGGTPTLDRNKHPPEILFISGYSGRHFNDRQDKVDQPRCDRVPRHIAVFGFIRILGNTTSAQFLYPFKTHRTVRACAGQGDGHCVSTARFSKSSEENINRGAAFFDFCYLGKHKVVVVHRQTLVWRNDVNMIWLDFDFFSHLGNRQFAVQLQDLCQFALVFRRHVEDNNIGDAGIRTGVRKEFLQGLYASGRRANSDDQHFIALWFCRFFPDYYILFGRRAVRLLVLMIHNSLPVNWGSLSTGSY